jgi:hypothetical protein
LCSIATQYTTRKETAELLDIPGSKEATPGSSNTVPSITAVQDAKRGTKGSKKRRKQCPQWVTVVVNYDDDNDKKVDGSGMECVVTAVHSLKRQAWPLMDHFERLLKEAYPNHVYPIKHKLKDCNMRKNFMTSGTLTQSRELGEDSGRSDTMPFLGEDAGHDGLRWAPLFGEVSSV